MVFGQTHALLAAATLLQWTSASAVNHEPAAAEVTVVKTVTNTHTVCPATSKPPVCKPTNTPGHGPVGGGYGGGHGGGHNRPENPDNDDDLWQKWLEKLKKEAEEEAAKLTKNPHVPWSDWASKTNGGSKPTGTGGGSGPTGLPDFSGECTKPIKGKPNTNKCNSAGNRSKWCDGKSIDSDYYEDYKSGNTCKYTLEITNTTLSFDKGPQISFAVNGQTPGPVIECNWGDWVEIDVINRLQNNATTIHWHGIHHKGTNDQDGVPGISECGIAPGQSRKYAWRASNYGTAWYHSHLLAQYADGIRGPMIIHGPSTADWDVDMGHVMVTDTFPAGTAFAQAERIARFGQAAVVTSNYLLNGNNKAVDMSTGKHTLWSVQKGKKHLFRIVNGAAQEAYSLHIDGHKFKVISADFVPIVPYETEYLNIAAGQRYEVIVEANQKSGNFFFRAITQTGCPSQALNNGLGLANGIIHYEDAVLTLPNTQNGGNRTAQTFATCADEPIAKLVPHLKKTAGTAAQFSAGKKDLPGGNVAQISQTNNIVQWFLNNQQMNVTFSQPTLQTLAEMSGALNSTTNGTAQISNSITIDNKGQWNYFIIKNQFFASHPMHLHGHDMSSKSPSSRRPLLNTPTNKPPPVLGQGNGEVDLTKLNFVNPIRRDTVMLNGAGGPPPPPGTPPPPRPLGYTVIGFESDNPGAWLMHCHIVWHVEGGMALQFIERPKEIGADKYASKPEFKKECAALKEYEKDPSKKKHEGQSGLKRSVVGEDVVRRDLHRHAHRNY